MTLADSAGVAGDQGSPPSSAGHIFALLESQAEETPDATAVVTAAGRWTYSEWLRESQRVAAALAADGVGPGDTVALIAPNRLEWLAVAFGAAAVGARLAPFNTWLKGPELAYLLELARPTVLVTVDRWARQHFLDDLDVILPGLRVPPERVVVLGAEAPAGTVPYGSWRSVDPAPVAPVRPPDDIAFVLFTSGSTAQPKGVTLTHRDLIANGFQIGARQGIGSEDRLLLVSPLFWSLGSANALFATLTHGTCLVLMDQFEAGEALRMIESERCTAIYTLTVITHALLTHEAFTQERVSSLRRGLTFGSPDEMRRVIDDLGVRDICNIYGSTELYGNCAVSPWDAPVEDRLASSGPALEGVEIRIVDPDTGGTLGAGATGEIQVRGRVTPGYLGLDGTISPVTDQDGWFATGDLGRLDERGWLSFAGRRSEMIKTAGINVSPAEVESVLVEHEDVAAAAVTGVSHPVRGEQVVAFVQLEPGSELKPEDLRTWAVERSASYKVPARIFIVDEFPTTTTGKLARRELRAIAEAEAQHG